MEKALNTLKQALCAQLLLVTSDFAKEFAVESNASNVGMDTVLSQIRDNEEHPVV